MEPLLRAHQLTKVYRVYKNPKHRIKEIIFRRPYHEPVLALDHVSLEVLAGSALGVIGENGAGKSTLLSILAGVLRPTGGKVVRSGKVASILDLGGGFHQEFSGRQNIQMSGAMLGLSQKEVETSIDRVIDFSELHHFIDKPLKTYSSGMHIRLAFSVAINVHPEILIIDEVLAVGDAYFQRKCIDHLSNYLQAGGSIVFCSHSMYAVAQFCQNAVWLKEGRVRAAGPAAEVIAAYENYIREKEQRKATHLHFSEEKAPSDTPRGGASPAWIEECSLNGVKDSEPPVCRFGETLLVRARLRTSHPEWKFHAGVAIDRNDHLNCYATSTITDRLPFLSGKDSFDIEFFVPQLPFLRGNYFLKLFILDETGIQVLDSKTFPFSVISEDHPWGVCYVPHEWRFERE